MVSKIAKLAIAFVSYVGLSPPIQAKIATFHSHMPLLSNWQLREMVPPLLGGLYSLCAAPERRRLVLVTCQVIPASKDLLNDENLKSSRRARDTTTASEQCQLHDMDYTNTVFSI